MWVKKQKNSHTSEKKNDTTELKPNIKQNKKTTTFSSHLQISWFDKFRPKSIERNHHKRWFFKYFPPRETKIVPH